MEQDKRQGKINNKLIVFLAISVVCLIGIIIYAANWKEIAEVHWSERITERRLMIGEWVQMREMQKQEMQSMRHKPVEEPKTYSIQLASMSREFPALMKVADRNSDVLSVPFISQEEVGYQTGCELVSAAMVLEYYGMEVTPSDVYDVIDKRSGQMVNRSYGVHPDEFFIGDPKSAHAFGCYVSPLMRAMNRLMDESWLAVNVSGTELSSLAELYLSKDTPIIIWATVNMSEPKPGQSWKLEDGSTFEWIAGEHCLVLVGEDADYYYFNDPNHAGEVIGYEKELVELRYAELHKQAIVVSR